ncbi:unnamed protein product [Brassica rapa subsp. trilocularis]
MSRCFPFPPPGYEKKVRTEEADSLIKERQKKEKKHRKDKKDKETSRDRYKEGKERKEKHRDKKDKEKSTTSQDKNNGNEESKFVQDLARRISNEEEEARESQSVGKSSFPCGVTENFPMGKRSESAVGRVSSWRDPKGTEIMVQPVGKKELQELNHLKQSVTKGDKSLDSEERKKSEPKYTSQENKEENTEAINKSKLKYVDNRNIGKRKDHERNGFLYENGSRLNKIHKPVASPVSSVENGRNLGAYQTPPKPVTELQETVCNPEVNEHRVNGFIDPQKHKSHCSAISNGEASAKKRPHSDLKYLDQILNVPKREELHEFDVSEEQEWLLGQSSVRLSKKPKKVSSTLLDETLQVWNQALSIEASDTVALPYVVPF